jgi:hypothetical protein
VTGPTPGAAIRAVRDALQLLLSCVSADVLVVDTVGVHTILRVKARVRRNTGDTLSLVWVHDVAVLSDAKRPRRDRWQAATVSYAYRLEDVDGREIVAYHWHPHGRSHIAIPHLHLGAALGTLRAEMTKAHLHTGMITPVAILSLAVERFGVAPRRSDRADIFERAERALAPR